jgi:hemerythrin-like domain-containing protein
MQPRRQFIASLAAGGALVLATGLPPFGPAFAIAKENAEVSSNEDLMREHGVLRRALLVYMLSAAKIRKDPGSVPPDALKKTAMLFRQFGEDYHERKLEEPFIFPAVRQNDPALSTLVDTLLAQHQRGREITDYILAESSAQKLTTGDEFPAALDSFALMYQQHTAREDTVIFPAWHESIGERKYKEMGEKFEQIERQQFGHDGFDDAVKQIAAIESQLGLADLAQFTAPPPPRVKTL